MKGKLTLKDDHGILNSEEAVDNKKFDRIVKINSTDRILMFNPTVKIEMKGLKKHNTLMPIMREDSVMIIKKKEPETPKKQVSEVKVEEKPSHAVNISNSISGKLGDSGKGSMVKPPPAWYKPVERFLDSNGVMVVMTIFTLFALFAGDVQAAWLEASVDIYFDSALVVLLLAFTIEIILSSIVKQDYLWSFFFWLDVIATISLLQDISFFFDYVLSGNGSLNPYVVPTNSTVTGSGVNADQATSAISKISAATRATRVLRIIRIIRLIRIVKLYKTAVMAREFLEQKKRAKERFEAYKQQMDASNSSNDASSLNSVRVEHKDEIIEDLREKVQEREGDAGENGEQGDNLENHELDSPDTNRNLDSPDHLTLVRKKEQTTRYTAGQRFSNVIDVKQFEAAEKKVKKSEEKKKKKLRLKKVKALEELNADEMVQELKISKILTESITKKVIILILGMLIIIPILSDDFFADTSLISYNILTKYIVNYWVINSDSYFELENPFDMNRQLGKMMNASVDPAFPIVTIQLHGILFYQNKSWVDYNFRSSEIKMVADEDAIVQIYYSCLTDTQLTGALNIGRTVFVCICLTLAAIFFEKDTQTLVLEPLEVMIEIVESVARDPINAKNVDNLRKGVKSTMLRIKTRGKGKNDLTEEQYEIKIIESAIIKISALLAIGFGEAGGEIITKNLNSGSELNPMLKGKKKTAIFGFCDIRSFPEVNEVLQEKSMLFVNQIAEIVHSNVDKYGGAANKNIGDAFLMVWKFKMDEEAAPEDEKLATLKKKKKVKDNLLESDPQNPIIQRTADMAVLGFLSVICKINKDLRILAYRQDPEILAKLENYKVKMGFGLHLGWAIEGAIGSSYKIDASYLSPNVNMAARLEAATKIYGVNILLSGNLYQHLSDDMKLICRLVDRVTVKGSKEPISLYTIDVNLNITPQKPKPKKHMSSRAKTERYQSKRRKIMNNAKLLGGVAKQALNKNSFREMLTTGRGFDFYTAWDEGLEHYFEGRWKNAGAKFKECLKIVSDDGPAKTLLRYLESNNFEAPKTWNKVRELTSKT